MTADPGRIQKAPSPPDGEIRFGNHLLFSAWYEQILRCSGRINLLLPHCTQHPSHMVGLPTYNFPLPEDPFIILISCWVWSQILRPSLLGCLFNHPHPYRIVSARISIMGDGAYLQNLCRSAFQKNPAWELPVTAPFSKGNWTFGFYFCMFGLHGAAVTECGDLAWWPLCGGGKSLCPS